MGLPKVRYLLHASLSDSRQVPLPALRGTAQQYGQT